MSKGAFKIALLGAGNMGGAMLRGWLEDGIEGDRICVVDPKPSDEMLALLKQHEVKNIVKLDHKLEVDIFILAVKPQVMIPILNDIGEYIDPSTLLVSVAAGITIDSLAQNFETNPIIRTMPNTPSQVGEGMSVCVGNSHVNNDHKGWVSGLLSAIGKVDWVEDEALIDPVTGVSGSGPAYIFHMVEAMAQAGVNAGLSEDLSTKLARQTIIGAAELLKQSDLGADQLRKNVTSPGGTTAAALEVLMAEDGLTQLMSKAVKAASDRSKGLAKLD
jgi:pyrroline-5-carboxylate reductase